MTDPNRRARDIQAAPSRARDVSQAGHPVVKGVFALLSAAALTLSGVGYFTVGRLGSQLSASELNVNTQSKSKGKKSDTSLDGAMDILLVGSDSRTDAQGNPLSEDELRRLNVGTEHDPQQIMTLDELLDLVCEHPGKHILIETKHPSPFGAALEEAVARVLRARGLEADERVHLISFNPEAIERFQRLLPELEAFLLYDERSAPFAPIGTCGAGPSIWQAKAQPELFDGGARTYVWTVNLPKDMLWLAERGASLIGTDLPHIAAETLR